MNRSILVVVGLLVAALLAACGGNQEAQPAVAAERASNEITSLAYPDSAALETIVDEQGAVSIAVTPVDLSGSAPTLDFEVAMNTHSVDLSMDLATLATLTTDNGRSVSAVLWDAAPRGHHVSGMLSFPSEEAGTALVTGISQLTLTIRDVDAPERTFAWSIDN